MPLSCSWGQGQAAHFKRSGFWSIGLSNNLKDSKHKPKSRRAQRYRISPWRSSSWKIYLCAMSISSHSSKNPLFCTQSHHTPRHCWCRHAGAHTYKAQICRRTQPPPFSVTRTSYLSVCTFTLNIHTPCSSHKQQ